MEQIKNVVRQVAVIGPWLWLLELFQNKLYYFATGRWGWVYPQSPYHWFTFETLPNWCLSVFVFYWIYRLWFGPKNMNPIMRIFIIGVLGVILEWCNGFLIHQITGKPLFLWENSSLLYIDYIALPMWWFNASVYHFMSTGFLNLTEEKSHGPTRTDADEKSL